MKNIFIFFALGLCVMFLPGLTLAASVSTSINCVPVRWATSSLQLPVPVTVVNINRPTNAVPVCLSTSPDAVPIRRNVPLSDPVLVYFVSAPAATSTTNTVIPSTGTCSSTITRTLRKGMSDTGGKTDGQIATLQNFLQTNNFLTSTNLNRDRWGRFGSYTRSALINFQRNKCNIKNPSGTTDKKTQTCINCYKSIQG